MRHPFPAILLFFILVGCRDTINTPTDNESPDTVTGIVRDRFGNPAAGVDIRLYFDFILISQTPMPAREWVVPDSVTPIRVVVVDSSGREIIELFRGTRSAGRYLALWDGRDSTGERPPSGIYSVRYLIRDSICHAYTAVTEGGIVARTDSSGVYSIAPSSIPIGASPIPIFSSDGRFFYGNHRIGNTIGLLFASDVASQFVEVPLSPGSGRRVDLTLE